MKTLLKPLGKSVLATVVFFAVLEVILRGAYWVRNLMVSQVPLPYVTGADYGPTPPWIDGLRMLEADGTLLWRGRPRFHQKYIDSFVPVHFEEERRAVYRRFFPSLPPSLKGKPVWEITLNSEGFRDSDFPKDKPPSAFRILCLGDSWTVGSNVSAEDAFPQRLKAMLKKEFPGADFEVFNMGMFGYTSVNGLRMMKRALELRPDVLILGFAMNEAKTAGVQPGNPAGEATQGPTWRPATGALKKEGVLEAETFASKHVEFYKLLKYYAQLLMWKPISMGQHFQDHAEAFRKFQWMNDNADADPWMRRLLDGYERNYLEMIRLAGTQGARVILLYPEFRRDAPFLRVLRKISEEKGLPLVDSSLLIAQARKAIEDGLERRLGLQPQLPPAGGGGEEVEVTFRVYAGDAPVPGAMSIVGTHERLGNLTPNKVFMADDGAGGDQQARDKVWSYTAKFKRGVKLFYTYTHSGRQGHWEGLDVPVLRSLVVEPPAGTSRLYAPIDTFGKMYLYADPWHTDAQGNCLIAGTLLDQLRMDEKVKSYLAGC